jgi:hypothetical protein
MPDISSVENKPGTNKYPWSSNCSQCCWFQRILSGEIGQNADCLMSLLNVLARLNQLSADAEAILADPGDVENGVAEELRELLVDMRAEVEAKLDALARQMEITQTENNQATEATEITETEQ